MMRRGELVAERRLPSQVVIFNQCGEGGKGHF